MSPRQHEQLGWGMIALFALLGLVLETLHGLKIGAYLTAANESRRLLWTLAHAHGVLLGLVHLGCAATFQRHQNWTGPSRNWASRLTVIAAITLPLGFFVGGAWLWGNDPNPAVLLSPLGGVALVLGAAMMWWSVRKMAD